WGSWDKGTRKTQIGRFGASQSISGGSEKFVPGSPGQLGQKCADDVNRPVQLKQRTFVLGHPGQRDAWDAESRKSRERMESCH
ncbi:hypothetical protein KI387_018448, partial [Taxus chinensis]